MSGHLLLYLVTTVTGWAALAWALTGAALTFWGGRVPAALWHYFHEVRPFYLPCVVVAYVTFVADAGHTNFGHVLGLVSGVANWFLFKDADKDDRWKRRRRKAAQRVARAGSRLVVTAGSPGA